MLNYSLLFKSANTVSRKLWADCKVLYATFKVNSNKIAEHMIYHLNMYILHFQASKSHSYPKWLDSHIVLIIGFIKREKRDRLQNLENKIHGL